MDTKPFFSRATTQRQVDLLACSDNLTIYAGAGASIDRTGVSWLGLSEALLSETLDGVTPTPQLLRAVGAQRLASVAVERLKSVHGDRTDERIGQVVHSLLYRDSSWVGGDLIKFLHLVVWIRIQFGLRTTILTTNYDNYLEEPFLAEEVTVRVDGKRVSGPDGGLGTISYLHGRIPRRGEGTRVVISHEQYAATQRRVTNEIRQSVSDADVLILGSSLDDPPLIRALVNSKGASKRSARTRFVLIPRQSNESLKDDLSIGLTSDWASHLGCEAVFPDFYSQVAQFVAEIGVCSVDPSGYRRRARDSTRYPVRLDRWWEEWFAVVDSQEGRLQGEHHQYLADALGHLARLMDAPAEEPLKLELWVRWKPAERRLALWASSVGDWKDSRSARAGLLRSDSEYVSIQAFCEGRPLLKETPSPQERWRTYLSVPVRVYDESGIGSHVAGAVTIASMYGMDSSSVAPRNRAALRRALVEMIAAGRRILSPTSVAEESAIDVDSEI